MSGYVNHISKSKSELSGFFLPYKAGFYFAILSSESEKLHLFQHRFVRKILKYIPEI